MNDLDQWAWYHTHPDMAQEINDGEAQDAEGATVDGTEHRRDPSVTGEAADRSYAEMGAQDLQAEEGQVMDVVSPYPSNIVLWTHLTFALHDLTNARNFTTDVDLIATIDRMIRTIEVRVSEIEENA
jgi:hypothetical protein